MWSFKRTFKEAFDTGGLLLLGLSCLFLFRQQYYPNVLGPLSFGMISAGALGFVRHIIKELGSGIESTKYQEILHLLEQRQSEIEANRCMLEELRDACSRFMAMREILEAWQGDPSLIEEQAAILAKILQPRDVATSRESTQESPSDVQLELLVGKSPRDSGNSDLIEGNVRGENLVQQEQSKRNPKSLKEQALQVQSNISASSQYHATEKMHPLKEEIRKQYLEITDKSIHEDPENICEKVTEKHVSKQDLDIPDESKHEDPENIRENVTDEHISKEDLGIPDESKHEDPENIHENVTEEHISKEDLGIPDESKHEDPENICENVTDEHISKEDLGIHDESKHEDPENIHENVTEEHISKQGDRASEHMGKAGDDGEECKREGIENLTERDVQTEQAKKEFQMKESGKLNPEDGKSENITSTEIQIAKENCDKEFKEMEQEISGI